MGEINVLGVISKRKKKKAPLSSEDEDEDAEEWIESGDSLDDIVINEVTDQETDDIIFQVEDLKVGDYILALFLSTGKRAVIHYKYVTKILQVLEGDDFEVQCLKSLDETKTTFKFIEHNDQCVIAKKEILGRLPDPQLIRFGRILCKDSFSAEKRKKEYTPSVITSERWVEYYELKEKEKKMKEDLKAEKKKKRELQKNNGKKPQVSKRKKKKAPLSSEDEDEEEWIESGDSLDDIVINEVTDQETDDIIFQVEDLKVGDYILALSLSLSILTFFAIKPNIIT
ncbi:hypothetical protein FQA39_LY03896 [Lamprigera yunnana]|nr:hypothetical protein FQA39_LY03896 [Lamprigera yunnana]